MLVYRIAHKRHNDHLFAPGIAGRWNGAGKRVLYCSESIPLAFLECMIRRQGVGFNHDYNIIVIDIPDSYARAVVDVDVALNVQRIVGCDRVCERDARLVGTEQLE